MAKTKSTAVAMPNLGLYFDRPSYAIDPRGLQAGFNFRVKSGKLSNVNLGWTQLGGFTLTTQGVAQPVTLIYQFLTRLIGERLIFGTPTDLYIFSNSGGGTVKYITPIYATGTASASGTAVTGTGTLWNTSTGQGTFLKNVKPGDEISFGNNNQTDPGATWFLIDAVNSDTSLTLHTSAGTVVNGNYTIRKKFTGSATNLWAGETFLNAAGVEDRVYLTNGIDPIVRWNGSTDQIVMPASLTFTCTTLVQYKNMMIYLNLTQSGVFKPTNMINSINSDPETVTGGIAQQYLVHSRADPIVRAIPLGDSLAIYSTKGCTVAQFVGSPTFFIFREAIIGKGPLGGRALARFSNYHLFIGADTQYIFDGTSVKEFNRHVWREILRTQDPVRSSISYSVFDEQNGDLIWVVPATTDPGSGTVTSAPAQAYVEHYLEEVGSNPRPYSLRAFTFYSTGFTTRNQAITWDQLVNQWQTYNFRWNDQFFFAAFPIVLGGGSDGKVYQIGGAQDANGVAMNSFVKFGRRPMVDGRSRGLLKRVYPFMTVFNNPMNVKVDLADSAEGTVIATQTSIFDQTQPQGGHFAPVYRRGRYYDLSFGTTGPGQPWETGGYDTDIVPGGKR